MKIFRGHQHPALSQPCALTIGNFDGVHRGHQAMLAVLKNEARHRNLPARVMTFEPHPREYFAPRSAPTRISTLRDKLTELARCGIDQTVVLPFNARLASQSASAFIEDVLVTGLQVRYVLVGDDFRFGSQRTGDYAMLDAAPQQWPLKTGETVGKARLYEDGIFPTPDGKAKFANTVYKPSQSRKVGKRSRKSRRSARRRR